MAILWPEYRTVIVGNVLRCNGVTHNTRVWHGGIGFSTLPKLWRKRRRGCSHCTAARTAPRLALHLGQVTGHFHRSARMSKQDRLVSTLNGKDK
jgi:hypothetical protein